MIMCINRTNLIHFKCKSSQKNCKLFSNTGSSGSTRKKPIQDLGRSSFVFPRQNHIKDRIQGRSRSSLPSPARACISNGFT